MEKINQTTNKTHSANVAVLQTALTLAKLLKGTTIFFVMSLKPLSPQHKKILFLKWEELMRKVLQENYINTLPCYSEAYLLEKNPPYSIFGYKELHGTNQMSCS